jgi:hypothetical protein
MSQENDSHMKQTIIPFEETVKDYISNNKPKVCILTPCYGGVCFVNYMTSLISTMDTFRKYNIPLSVEFCKNDSLVSRARNNLVAKAMNDPEMTNIIFIDADITWSPVDIIKLLIANKSLIGGVYPLKHYYLDKLLKDVEQPGTSVVRSYIDRKNKSQFKDVISDADMVEHNLLKYNINYIDNSIQIENNLTRVKHLATGFMMIQRGCIEQMSKAFPSTKYTDDVGFLSGTENDYAYALFDCGVEYGHYLSEDWMFCDRWKKMGGSIWIDVTINLTHTGNADFKGSYIASII